MADQNEQNTQTAQISGTVQIKQDGAGQPQEKKPEVEEPAPKKSKKGLVIGIVVVLVILAGIYFWRSTRPMLTWRRRRPIMCRPR